MIYWIRTLAICFCSDSNSGHTLANRIRFEFRIIPAARLASCFCFIRFVSVVCRFFSGEAKLNQWRGLVYLKLVQAPTQPSNFIAGCPKAALLFCFFCDFRCGVLLFIDILVIYEY